MISIFKNVLGSRMRTERVSPNYVIIMTIAIACVWMANPSDYLRFVCPGGFENSKWKRWNNTARCFSASVDAIF